MKVLIWFACFFVVALIRTSIQESGIILGGLPTALLYLGAYFIARSLCKSLDERKTEKKTQEGKNAFKHNNSFCKECGQRLMDQGKFCNKCGTEAMENPLNDGKFCIRCGANITHDSDNCHVCFAEIHSK